MRKKLVDKVGLRKKFIAVFAGFGKKVNFNGYAETTILFKDIVDADTNLQVTDHHWFSYTKGFEKIILQEGIWVSFDARVKEYKKGYVNKKLGINNRKSDYKLSHPTNIQIVKPVDCRRTHF